MNLRLVALASLLLAGCSGGQGPGEFAAWDVLNEVGSPMRWKQVTWPVDDNSRDQCCQ